jgi:hypothetical protein
VSIVGLLATATATVGIERLGLNVEANPTIPFLPARSGWRTELLVRVRWNHRTRFMMATSGDLSPAVLLRIHDALDASLIAVASGRFLLTFGHLPRTVIGPARRMHLPASPPEERVVDGHDEGSPARREPPDHLAQHDLPDLVDAPAGGGEEAVRARGAAQATPKPRQLPW